FDLLQETETDPRFATLCRTPSVGSSHATVEGALFTDGEDASDAGSAAGAPTGSAARGPGERVRGDGAAGAERLGRARGGGVPRGVRAAGKPVDGDLGGGVESGGAADEEGAVHAARGAEHVRCAEGHSAVRGRRVDLREADGALDAERARRARDFRRAVRVRARRRREEL